MSATRPLRNTAGDRLATLVMEWFGPVVREGEELDDYVLFIRRLTKAYQNYVTRERQKAERERTVRAVRLAHDAREAAIDACIREVQCEKIFRAEDRDLDRIIRRMNALRGKCHDLRCAEEGNVKQGGMQYPNIVTRHGCSSRRTTHD